MSRLKNFRQSNWLIELSPWKNVEPRIAGIRSTFRGSTFFRKVETRLNTSPKQKNSGIEDRIFAGDANKSSYEPRIIP